MYDVLLAAARWKSSRGYARSTRSVIFRKGNCRLVVEVFGRECSVLKLSEVKPRFRGWKAWSQPFYMVAGKLARLGWKKESDVPRVEVSHAH